MSRLRLLLSFAALLCAVIVVPAQAQREKFTPEELAIIKQKFPEAKRTVTGLRYVITKEGEGEPAAAGDVVSVLYRGMLMDGRVFNEALDPAHPFSFRLGRGNVVEGWDQGLKLMKPGSKMTLIIPFELAYGTKGNPPAVPREASLIFEIEMLKIEYAPKPPAPPPEPPKRKKVLGVF